MKKKNTAKKAVLPALLAVLCSTAALTSVSYAWFTIGDKASVESIDVEVQAAKGMQISADASTWKSVIPVTELATVPTNEMLQDAEDELKPVSSAGTVEAGALKLFYGEVQKDGGVATTKDAAGKYVSFDLYVKLTVDKKLNLDLGSSVLDTNGSHMASRVAFINQGNVVDGTAEAAQALSKGTEAKIWEPNSAVHYSSLVSGVQDYHGVNGVIEYTGDVRPSDYDSKFTEIKGETLLRPAYDEAGLTTASQYLFDLKAGVNKISVYIWLEGQDVDCINEVSAGTLKTVLNFSVSD